MNNTVDVVKNLSHVTQATQHNHKQAYICAKKNNTKQTYNKHTLN